MIDYRGIEALHTVIELQSFEMAAQKLHITQSAVSQRIKTIETHYGEPILVRTLPYRPTVLGKQLIGHFKRVCLLEEDLENQLAPTSIFPRMSIAINRDSLETWFLEWASEAEIIREIILEVIADDQELTLNYLKNGLVSACLSTSGKAIIGGEVKPVGSMDYMLVASPSFIKNYFSNQDLKQNLLKAQAIKFDQNDRLHERYLETFFQLDDKELKTHVIPSVRGFKQFVLLGYGYALIPRIDIVEELKKKQLILLSEKVWELPMYWHSWAVESILYRKFNREIVKFLIRKFNQKGK
jgi:LysR family transcriptional regulator, chromosome initiation inhibitor